jgi:hypothetical protein
MITVSNVLRQISASRLRVTAPCVPDTKHLEVLFATSTLERL